MPYLIVGIAPTPAVAKVRVLAWALTLAALVFTTIALGIAVRGRALGVLVDERNRYSLSRLQMLLWSILVISTLHVVFASNIWHAMDPKDALVVDFDWNLMVLMGISMASFVTSPLALSRKADAPPDPAALARNGATLAVDQHLARAPSARGRLLVKHSPGDARLADLVRGEDVGDAATLDLPRLQMLLLTAVVVGAYGAALASVLWHAGPIVTQFPSLSQTLLMLVTVSHAGYLAGKFTPTMTDSATDLLPRALLASQQATALATDLQLKAALVPPGDPRSATANNAATLARAASAEAAALAGSVGKPGFSAENLAALEGRLRALKDGLSAWTGSPATDATASAPSIATVQAVQAALGACGYPVTAGGIVDTATTKALDDEMARLGIDRVSFHPQSERFLEEICPLIGRSVG